MRHVGHAAPRDPRPGSRRRSRVPLVPSSMPCAPSSTQGSTQGEKFPAWLPRSPTMVPVPCDPTLSNCLHRLRSRARYRGAYAGRALAAHSAWPSVTVTGLPRRSSHLGPSGPYRRRRSLCWQSSGINGYRAGCRSGRVLGAGRSRRRGFPEGWPRQPVGHRTPGGVTRVGCSWWGHRSRRIRLRWHNAWRRRPPGAPGSGLGAAQHPGNLRVGNSCRSSGRRRQPVS